MTIHIGAKNGEVAETVLMPGDPLRAQYIANKYLQNVNCYNQVRGMFGFTGTYKGKRVSIQGSGMGIPSISIYANELITSFNVKRLIRIGSCGAIQKEVKIRDIILGMSACTDSAINNRFFDGRTFAPTATFSLLHNAYNKAHELGMQNILKVGSIVSTDLFYDEPADNWKVWSRHGVLAIEMEAAGLYTLAARHNVEALAILTVSDHLIDHLFCTSEEREKTFDQMLGLALELI